MLLVYRMSPTYAQNKKHIYNYVINNPDKIQEINRKWRKANLESVNEGRRQNYKYQCECDINIQFKLLRKIEII